MDAISVAALRGADVESRHRVHAVAVHDGKVVATAGDRALATYFRSGAKPFQAAPLARERPDLGDGELAIACASHEAEPAQLAAVRRLLAAAPAEETELECGPNPIEHNCSGKHAGFLALCRARGWPSAGYRLASHPLQQLLLAEIAAVADAPAAPTAVDGCGVPTFHLRLESMALAFTRLDGRVLDAMRSHPRLVGGEGVVDTELMLALPGWAAKRGAEGLLCVRSPEGVGIALKVEDGAPRAVRPATRAFLRRLGHDLGDDFSTVLLENSRGEVVGEVRAE